MKQLKRNERKETMKMKRKETRLQKATGYYYTEEKEIELKREFINSEGKKDIEIVKEKVNLEKYRKPDTMEQIKILEKNK